MQEFSIQKLYRLLKYFPLILFFFLFSSLSFSQHDEDFQQRVYKIFSSMLGNYTTYIVQSGDTLFKIAKKFNVAYPAIVRANQLQSYKVRPGQTLVIPNFRVVPEEIKDGIVLNLPELTLYYYENGKVVNFFPVAIGRLSFRTPVGKFKIAIKRLNPTWYPPEWAGLEKPVPPGPENPLGDRWMGLSIPMYGIHSTNSPRSIGRIISHGCIRMYPWNVEKLWNKVNIGTPVNIVYSPVKLGYSNGRIYLEVHRDVYYWGTNRYKTLLKILKDKGILELVDLERVKTILTLAQGVPVPILGEDIKIFSEGEEVRFNIAPIIKGDEIFVELEKMIEYLSIEYEFDETRNTYILMKWGIIVEIDLDSKSVFINGRLFIEKLPVFKILGRTLIPLEILTDAIGAELRRDEIGQALYIIQ